MLRFFEDINHHDEEKSHYMLGWRILISPEQGAA